MRTGRVQFRHDTLPFAIAPAAAPSVVATAMTHVQDLARKTRALGLDVSIGVQRNNRISIFEYLSPRSISTWPQFERMLET